MKRAALASGTLQSAAFTLSADISLPVPGTPDVHAELEGVLQRGGKDAMFTADVRGKVPSQSGLHSMQANLDAVVTWGEEAYVRLNGLTSVPPYPLLPADQLSSIRGVWWRIPGDRKDASVSPDPNLLISQSKVVTVTKDRGIQRIHGAEAYRYDVSIDPEKLVAFLGQVAERDGRPFDRATAMEDLRSYTAKGELWVDADTFLIHRVVWDVVPADPARGLTLSLRADLTDHGNAKPVTPPVQYRTLQGGSFLEGALSGSAALLPAPAPEDNEEETSILDEVLNPDASVETGTGEMLENSVLPFDE